MSKFDEMMRGNGVAPVGKRVEFYADCPHCDEEVTEADYYPNEQAIVYICNNKHRNVMEGIDLPL